MWRSALVLLSRSIPNPRARVKLHVDAPAVRPAPATSPKRPTQPARMEANRVAAPSSSSPAEGTAATNDGSAQPRVPVYRPGRWDIWILGISIGLGGQYFSWNEGLKSGLYTFLIEYFLVGFAYIALCCCTSEITGALPFAGGAYGLSRCTLGFYPGFIIGCAEAIEYIIYVATSVLALADMFVESIPELDGFEPLIWLLVYASALFFHIRGDYVFWRWNIVIGVLSLFFVLLYCIGSFPHTNFALNADNDPDFRFVHGTHGFMRSLPLACWFFVGVEALNLASDDVVDPKRSIPFAQLSCILSLFLSGIVVFFVTVSLPPPGLNQVSKLLAPFDNGFQLLFTISVKTATLFSIPAMYATTFGFMWGYGKLIAAMATSKLLPPIIARPHPMYQTPYLAVLLGSTLSYFMCLLVFYVPQILDKYLFNICIAMAFIGYAGQCIGYISLKRNYPNIKSSTFHSPFGNYGAVYSLIIWLIGLVSVAGFQENGGIEILVFGGIIFVLTLFYFGYAQSRQTLSSKENKVFLMAHVMKFGKSRKKQWSRTT
uniref:Amino acid permease/ SLC12A domain-containing protein n=1 Tax=Globisporangium ultimum (strain ATCC 200006 / CBS 805.95 / DAOM BR144) TaxID=431595 RepID=K3X4Z5_GLOUD